MSTIQQFKDVLRKSDSPAAVLDLADSYMPLAQKLGAKFGLPPDHEYLRPVIAKYAADLSGWLTFIKKERDQRTKGARSYDDDLHALYRRVHTRVVQQERRDRINRAIAAALATGLIENTVDAKAAYSRKCVAAWQLRRQKVRKSLLGGGQERADRDEFNDAVDQMWADIDAEIARGELPK